MSATARLLATQGEVAEGLRRFLSPPAWLGAPGRPAQVRAALERAVPELAAGELEVRRLHVRRLRLKTGAAGWTGHYELEIGRPGDQDTRVTLLGARVAPPGFAEPTADPPAAPLGEPGWRVYLPELRLELEAQPDDPALPALPILTDPERARALLERSIRGAAGYDDLRIAELAITALRYRPGSRATVIYRLGYAPDDAASGWPETVVAKAHSGGKGQNAYDSMAALWASPLARGGAVALAEPLAYLPELKLLLQGPIAAERTLKDLIRTALVTGEHTAHDALQDAMHRAAAGLAALHGSGVIHGPVHTWQDELAALREVIGRLAAPLPDLADAAEPLLRRLETLAAETPPDPLLPAHGDFRPAHVLLAGEQVGLIDFADFGWAEPAHDLSRFLCQTRALAFEALQSRDIPEDEAAAQADALAELFLAAYERHTPVSRQRLALWEALGLLAPVLSCWTRIEPERLPAAMLLLDRRLRRMGVL